LSSDDDELEAPGTELLAHATTLTLLHSTLLMFLRLGVGGRGGGTMVVMGRGTGVVNNMYVSEEARKCGITPQTTNDKAVGGASPTPQLRTPRPT